MVALPNKPVQIRVALNSLFVAFEMDNVDGVKSDQVVEKTHVSVGELLADKPLSSFENGLAFVKMVEQVIKCFLVGLLS